MKIIDLRSDTVTKPTEEMRRAMAEAEVGDDVYGEDPTVNRLERLAAETVGKEAAIFVPTGTMGNQAAIMAQTRPGDELIAASACHVIQNEGGGVARLSGVACALAPGSTLEPEDIRRLVRPSGNVHYPRTRLVCLENALGNGGVVPLDRMKSLYETAREYDLAVHLDGARLFNAAQALGVAARDLAAWTDSLTFCLSKGLCAPVGALICGSGDFIAEVRRCRKVLGGGMRQAGVLAAAGLIALTAMTRRLGEDHANALHLGRLLADIPGVLVDLEAIKINMVFWSPDLEDFDDLAFLAFMAERGVKVSGRVGGRFRLVTHHDISREDVEFFTEQLKAFLSKTRA